MDNEDSQEEDSSVEENNSHHHGIIIYLILLLAAASVGIFLTVELNRMSLSLIPITSATLLALYFVFLMD